MTQSQPQISIESFNEFILNPFSNDTQIQYTALLKEFKKSDLDDAWSKWTTSWARDFFLMSAVIANSTDQTNSTENSTKPVKCFDQHEKASEHTKNENDQSNLRHPIQKKSNHQFLNRMYDCNWCGFQLSRH